MRAAVAAVALLLSLLSPSHVSAAEGEGAGNVFDPFFRFTSNEHKAFFGGLPGETVDPFTGTLRVSQEDLVLPGVAGLDLHVVRTYSSKIWGRSDRFTSYDPLLAESEHSVLGYGWSLGFGLLRNPWASGDSGFCSGDLPVFIGPDGSSQVFYRGQDGTFVSKEYWRLEYNCPDPAGTGICVWTDQGLRYEFSADGGGLSGTTPVRQVSRIVDTFGNAIQFLFVPPGELPVALSIPPVRQIVDTYGRTIDFTYSYDGEDGARLSQMTANGKVYQYDYVTASSADTAGPDRVGLPGRRRFLSRVTPPAGAPYTYDYWLTAPVAQNQFALRTITYPSGGTSRYTYESVPFFTGNDTVPFAVVKTRVLEGRDVPSATWSYAYVSPEPFDQSGTSPRPAVDPSTGAPTDMSVTTVTRPDQKSDHYVMFGFAAIAGMRAQGFTYLVGLTSKIGRADGAEWELIGWKAGAPISSSAYPPPSYGSQCAALRYPTLWDQGVVPARMRERVVYRDPFSDDPAPGAARVYSTRFRTEYTSFDPYGQPTRIVETGAQAVSFVTGDVLQFGGEVTRTTELSYWSLPSDPALSPPTVNLLRGRPASKIVTEGTESTSSSWTYDGPSHAMDSETIAGMTTRYGYHSGSDEGPGNVQSITRSVDPSRSVTLTLQGYGPGAGWGVPTILDFNGDHQVVRTATREGWVTSSRDGLGRETAFDYDAVGRTTRITPPGDNEPTTFTWAPDDSEVTLTRGEYVKTTWFDGLGRELGTSDVVGTSTVNGFDPMGRQWFRSYPLASGADPVGLATQFDGLGRALAITKAYRPETRSCDVPGACSELHHYQSNCTQTITLRDPGLSEGQSPITYRCSASFGDPSEARLVALADAIGNVWQFGYSVRGHLSQVVPPATSGERKYDWIDDLLWREQTSESGSTYFDHNQLGQPTRRSDARVETTYSYQDPLSRLTHVTFRPRTTGMSYDGDEDVTRTYDAASNLKTLSSTNGGAYSYDYDETDRLRTQTWTYGGQAYTTSYSFDRAGCLRSMAYPTGVTLTMTCDAASRPKSVAVSGGPTLVSSITYDPASRPAVVVAGDSLGTTTTTTFDDRGRVQRLLVQRVMDRTYGYDGADNVTSITDALDSTFTRTMEYDKLNQLQVAIAPWLWGTAVYDYDPLGNRFLNSTGDFTTHYDYDASNRLVRARGGPRLRPVRLEWNLAGQLARSSDGATYRHDGHGRRVRKTTASEDVVYHYDAAGRVLAETDASGTALRSYVYLGGRLLAVLGCVEAGATPPCSDVQWYHTDALGSVVARSNTAGQVTRLDYQPWGEQQAVTAGEGDRQYNGRVYDPGTGFHDYGARMYWPEIGRFISADSYAGDIANPASLNRYSYVHNNPYKYTDPTGHFAWLVALAPAAIWCAEGGCERLSLLLLDVAEMAPVVVDAIQKQMLTQDGALALPPSEPSAPPTTVPGTTPTATPTAIPGSTSAGAGVATGVPASVAAAPSSGTVSMMAEHTKNARPSTQEKHQKGQARKDRDKKGGEKGDARRPYSREGNKNKPKDDR